LKEKESILTKQLTDYEELTKLVDSCSQSFDAFIVQLETLVKHHESNIKIQEQGNFNEINNTFSFSYFRYIRRIISHF
jgi:hypothetical protein